MKVHSQVIFYKL